MSLNAHPTQPLSPRASTQELVRLIREAAAGRLPAAEFIQAFGAEHDALERAGGARYASPEQARLIWDVLWAVAFYAPNLSQAEDLEAALPAEAVMLIVRRVADKLASLAV